MSTKGNYKTLNKPAIHTDSSGRDDRRSHPVGKQELCGQRHPVWRSFTVFTSACFAVPSCQQPSTIHCKQLLKHVMKMKHKHFDKNLYNWQTILKQTTNNFWWQLFHRVPAFCSYCLRAAHACYSLATRRPGAQPAHTPVVVVLVNRSLSDWASLAQSISIRHLVT